MLGRTARNSVILSLGLLQAALAQEPTPLGEPFRVNAHTPSSQADPVLCSAASGSFVIVWTSYLQDGSSTGIYGRRFDRDGNAVGAEFRVNTTSLETQEQASVACAWDGSFVVVWANAIPRESRRDVRAQIFEADGSRRGGEQRIDAADPSYDFGPSVGADPAGNYFAVWVRDGSVRGRRFDRTGQPLGEILQIGPGAEASNPEIEVDSFGRAVVVWQDFSFETSDTAIHGQRFGADGQPVGGVFESRRGSGDYQVPPRAAIGGGGRFVVAWPEIYNSGGCEGPHSDGVRARRFASDGRSLGSEFEVSRTSAEYSADIDVSASESGPFVVVWTESYPSTGVYGRVYDAQGEARADRFQVSTTERYAFTVSASNFVQGRVVIAWSAYEPNSYDQDVYARRYQILPEVEASPTPEVPPGEQEDGGCGTVGPGTPTRGTGGGLLLASLATLSLATRRRRPAELA